MVVDTGMHALGWSRQQALEYVLDNTEVSLFEANDEIDRYITKAAQALTYTIGDLKIREHRTLAESELCPGFDVRGFHATGVGTSSVPIAVLGQIVQNWIEQEKGNQK